MFKNERGLALGQSDCRIFTSATSEENDLMSKPEFLHGNINPENAKVELILWWMWSKICCLKKMFDIQGQYSKMN